jgi:hypothetical protein
MVSWCDKVTVVVLENNNYGVVTSTMPPGLGLVLKSEGYGVRE